MSITTDMLLNVGAKTIWSPTKLGKKYCRGSWENGCSHILAVIVHTPWGEHFKEVSNQSTLDAIRRDPFQHADYYELTRAQVEALTVERAQ